jgi:hypothetical protein
MRPNPRPARSRQNWLLSVIAMLAMASQFVLAIAPLAEGREDRMASHVEAGGAQTHFAHTDGNCVSCQARSIHGTATRPASSFFEGEIHAAAIASVVDRTISIDLYSVPNPRAPPRVI